MQLDPNGIWFLNELIINIYHRCIILYSLFKNDQIMSDVFFPIMHLDSVGSSHSISVDVNNPDEINEIFDGITYGKVDIIKKYFNRV